MILRLLLLLIAAVTVGNGMYERIRGAEDLLVSDLSAVFGTIALVVTLISFRFPQGGLDAFVWLLCLTGFAVTFTLKLAAGYGAVFMDDSSGSGYKPPPFLTMHWPFVAAFGVFLIYTLARSVREHRIQTLPLALAALSLAAYSPWFAAG